MSKRLLSYDDLQLSEALTEDPHRLKDMADPAIQGTFAVESLSTVTEIALNCTGSEPSDRPSIDDVLWNLQYSMQVTLTAPFDRPVWFSALMSARKL